MITSIERIGTEESHDGWFRVNKHVDMRFVEDENHELRVELNFDDSILTEQEAFELSQEVLHEAIHNAKSILNA